jgi:hypothetical protein
MTSADAVLTVNVASAYAGYSAAALGDMDGDGLDEVAIGSYWPSTSYRGRVMVFLGGGISTGTNAVPDAYVEGANTSDYLGYSSSAYRAFENGGDFNGDGFADLVCGAYQGKNPSGSANGTAYVVLGPMSTSGSVRTIAQASFYGETNPSYAGWSIDGNGDVNRDGFTDVIVGAYYHNPGTGNGAGAGYLIYGPQTGTMGLSDVRAKMYGTAANEYVGTKVGFIGDQDGDDSDEVGLGAYYSGSAAGKLYVVFGTNL